MKSSKIALVLGAMAAVALGMSAEACSSSSSTGTTGSDAGGSGTGKGTGTGTGKGGTGGTGTGSGTGTTGTGTGTGTADAGCHKAPPKLHPETKAGVYCPFAADGGGPITCSGGQECCVTPISAGTPSTCQPSGPCPVSESVKIECEGTPDCASGQICCGFGTIDTQPACGTIPAYPYVSGFGYGPSGVKGSGGAFCATSCVVQGDGGPLPTFRICSQQSECVTGTCTPVEPSGVGIGYCAGSGMGSGTGTGAGTGTGSGTGTGTGTDAGTTTDAHAG